MTLKDKVKALCEERGITVYKLEKALGLANGSVKHWDTSMPSGDKILALSRYFNVKPEYFLIEENEPEYYIDPKVSEMMQEIKDNPNFRLLFDASKKLKEDDIKFILEMIERMK